MILVNDDNTVIQIIDSQTVLSDLLPYRNKITKTWSLHLINCHINYTLVDIISFHKIILEQCFVVNNVFDILTTTELGMSKCNIWTDLYLTNIKNIIIHHCEFHFAEIKVSGSCYSLIMDNNSNISKLDLTNSILINVYIIPYHSEILPSSVKYYETNRSDWYNFDFNIYPKLEYVKSNITAVNNTFRTSIYMEINQAICVAEYLHRHPEVAIINNYNSTSSMIYNYGKYEVCADGHIRINTDYDMCEALNKMVIDM
jgi:hypothetical protein